MTTKAQVIEIAQSVSEEQVAAVKGFFADELPSQCITRQSNLRYLAVIAHFETFMAENGEDEDLRDMVDEAKAAMA